jgi:hypothetical protein
LLKDELLNEAFAYLEAEYTLRWRSTGVADADTAIRERLWQAINLLGKVRDHLKKVVADGKVSRRDLDQLEIRRRQRAA